MKENNGKETPKRDKDLRSALAELREMRSESETLLHNVILSDQKISDLKSKIESSDSDLIETTKKSLQREERIREHVRKITFNPLKQFLKSIISTAAS